MTMLYSAATRGFYSREIHGDAIPADAVEITNDEHAALLAGQAEGKRIVPGPDGVPELRDPEPPTQGEIAASARARRAALLAASDWTQLPDVPAATRAAWKPYRQALRDVPDQPGFPTSIDWPAEPT